MDSTDIEYIKDSINRISDKMRENHQSVMAELQRISREYQTIRAKLDIVIGKRLS